MRLQQQSASCCHRAKFFQLVVSAGRWELVAFARVWYCPQYCIGRLPVAVKQAALLWAMPEGQGSAMRAITDIVRTVCAT